MEGSRPIVQGAAVCPLRCVDVLCLGRGERKARLFGGISETFSPEPDMLGDPVT